VHGAYTDEPMSGSDVTLAERLRDSGYVTCAVTGGGYLASEYGLMRGFERVLYHFEPRIDPEQTGNDIESGMERALDWLDRLSERPFFLLFHTYEIHSPYRARSPYFEQFRGSASASDPPVLSTVVREPRKEEGFQVRAWLQQRKPGPVSEYRQVEPDELPLLNDLYDSEIAFADFHVDRLLDRLVQLGLDDSTIVIVTSDHGESLGEGGLAGHSSLQECELLVPLIVATPARQGAGTRVSTQVRLLDVAPTVLDLLGMEPLGNVQGVSLVPLLLGRDANVPDEAWSYAGSSNFGLGLRLANRLKYTYNNSPWPPISGVEALYRLDESPAEFTRIATEDQTAEELRELAREHYRATTSGLRVSLSNRESFTLRIALKGRNLTPLQVKAFAFGGVDIAWKSQTIFFTLPSGEEVTLFCEGRVFGELLVEIAPPVARHGPRRLRRVVDLDHLVQPWQANLIDGEWVDVPASDLEGVTGVRVAIEGDRVRFRRELHRVTEELHEQLRSLGYVR
jgi:arylsulfatase A-like enzyme